MRLIDADKLKKSVLDLPNCYNGFSDTYGKACIIGVIDEQPTIQSQWIPVSERLPERGKTVLFCDDSGDIYVGHYAIEHWWSIDDKVKSVIAWMPLPIPYEVSEE